MCGDFGKEPPLQAECAPPDAVGCRHTASLCKFVVCNAIVSVAFCLEVQLLGIITAFLFSVFTVIFYFNFSYFFFICAYGTVLLMIHAYGP